MALSVLALFGGPASAASQEEAQRLYDATCAVCHGVDGAGTMPGVPDFTVEDGPLSKPDAVLIRSTLLGIERPGVAAMPPKGGNPALTAEQIAALVRYMRTAFGP